MKYKIALLNIQRCNSHGAVLLAYALEKVLISNGFEVQNIDYKYAGRFIDKNLIEKYFKIIKLKIKNKLHLTYLGKSICDTSLKKEYDMQAKNFSSFRKKFLHLTREVVNVDDKILNNFDIFIVGSDVVWKPEIARCIDREIYFLKTVPKKAKKIAYAASIGTNDKEILDKHEKFYRNAFDDLDYISIREQSMINFVKKYTNKSVKSVIDPVFLLDVKDYIKIEKKPKKVIENKEYIYVYLLSKNERAIRFANKLAKKENISILIDLNDAFKDSDMISVNKVSAINAGPSEFLYNIRHAKYVITDSFHTTAFSILFNRKFWVFPRGKISIRMEDLLDRFNLNFKMVKENISKDVVNWNIINEKIKKERNEGLKYLLGAIKDEKYK